MEEEKSPPPSSLDEDEDEEEEEEEESSSEESESESEDPLDEDEEDEDASSSSSEEEEISPLLVFATDAADSFSGGPHGGSGFDLLTGALGGRAGNRATGNTVEVRVAAIGTCFGSDSALVGLMRLGANIGLVSLDLTS